MLSLTGPLVTACIVAAMLVIGCSREPGTLPVGELAAAPVTESEENLAKAKVAVDRVADAQRKAVADQATAHGDDAKIKQIDEAYEKSGRAMMAELGVLRGTMTNDDKQVLVSYGRLKLDSPMLFKLNSTLGTPTEAPVGATNPAPVAPAFAAPSPPSAADLIEKCLAEMPSSRPFTGALKCIKAARAAGRPAMQFEARLAEDVIKPAVRHTDCVEAVVERLNCQTYACQTLCARERGCGSYTGQAREADPYNPCQMEWSDCLTLCLTGMPQVTL